LSLRAILFTALALFACTAAGTSARAQAIAYQDAELLAALENSYWISLNGPHEKKVYVLAAPWCPVCRALHRTLTQSSQAIEYRFILTAPRTQADRVKVGRAAFSRKPSSLDAIYGSSSGPEGPPTPAEEFAGGFNDALWTAINAALEARSTKPFGFPALVFLQSARVRVIAGLPADFSALAASIDPESAPRAANPQLAALMAAPPKLTPIEAKVAYARQDGTVLYAAPDSSSAKLTQAKTGVGFMAKAQATGQDGKRWYAFQFLAEGPPAAFGKIADFR
jgi:hypothetical protein